MRLRTQENEFCLSCRKTDAQNRGDLVELRRLRRRVGGLEKCVRSFGAERRFGEVAEACGSEEMFLKFLCKRCFGKLRKLETMERLFGKLQRFVVLGR